MLRVNALAVLAVLALSGCGLQSVQPETGLSTGTPMATAPEFGTGPYVFPTRLTFSSPKARPKVVLVGPDSGLQAGECTGTGLVITVSLLSPPRIGPRQLFVFTVTPHALGTCTVLFYKKSSHDSTTLHVTVR